MIATAASLISEMISKTSHQTDQSQRQFHETSFARAFAESRSVGWQWRRVLQRWQASQFAAFGGQEN